MKESLFDRIALWLWRDRHDYDPAIGGPSAKHNVSLWTRWAPKRKRLFGAIWNGQLWIAFIGGGFAILAAILPMYLDARSKADQQVDTVPGELLLHCIKQPDGILTCRELVNRDNKVIPAANGDRLNHDGTAKP